MRSRNAETGEIVIRGMVLTADDVRLVVERHGLAEVAVGEVVLNHDDIRFVLDCQRMAKFIRANGSGSHATVENEAHQ